MNKGQFTTFGMNGRLAHGPPMSRDSLHRRGLNFWVSPRRRVPCLEAEDATQIDGEPSEIYGTFQ